MCWGSNETCGKLKEGAPNANEDFSGTILSEAERLQIRLFEPPQAVSFEFAVERALEWSKKYC
jgi:hypothetical protein